MVKARTFQPEDLYRIASLREIDAATVDTSTAVSMASRGPCWTFESGGRVLGVGGFIMGDNGWARLWGLVSDHMSRQEGVAATLLAARLVRQVRWLGAERIEALTEEGWHQGERTLRLLGFDPGDNVIPYMSHEYRVWERAA